MMMLKMMNPMGSMPSVPKMGGNENESGLTKEEMKEQERLRQEELKRVERERQAKYKKEREVRDAERDKVRERYNIQKKPQQEEEEEEESDDEVDTFGAASKKPKEPEDAMTQAKNMAENKVKEATSFFKSFF